MGSEDKKQKEIATLGGGCFWCIETLFEKLKGVTSVTSGYSGGSADQANYYSVSTGNTGHAEVIQIEFEPDLISYSTILDIFFDFHDPTTLNQQGPDIGPQYRSIILYHNNKQLETANRKIGELQNDHSSQIVTEVKPFKKFFEAEEYHQKYFDKNPNQFYCQVNIKPKIEKLESKYSKLLK